MIRPATPGDAPAIARVHVQSWEESYRGNVPDASLDAQSVEARIVEWEYWLRADEAVTFVSEDEEGVHGFVMARLHAGEPGYDALLDTLYVLNSHQKRGIGRELLRAAAHALRESGARKIWLLTLRDRNPARAFYESLGATLVREQPAPPILGDGVMDCVYGFELVTLQ